MDCFDCDLIRPQVLSIHYFLLSYNTYWDSNPRYIYTVMLIILSHLESFYRENWLLRKGVYIAHKPPMVNK